MEESYLAQQVTSKDSEAGSIINDVEENTKLSAIPGEIAFRMKDLTTTINEQMYKDIEKEFIQRIEAILYAQGIDFELVERIIKMFRSSD